MGVAVAHIGPNAIIQVALALRAAGGHADVQRLFRRAGLARYLSAWPERMVAEVEVVRLHHTLLREWPDVEARRCLRDAGRRTADYLLAHRIPVPVQAVLKILPARWAARALMRAVARHAWTFVGSGRFQAQPGVAPDTRWVLQIEANPLCRGLPRMPQPACDYYAATFERLFAALVHREATVVETACEARGDVACRFAVRWP
jgi:divinyl protochlorophyllide a 8-vinyl-reductase